MELGSLSLWSGSGAVVLVLVVMTLTAPSTNNFTQWCTPVQNISQSLMGSQYVTRLWRPNNIGHWQLCDAVQTEHQPGSDYFAHYHISQALTGSNNLGHWQLDDTVSMWTSLNLLDLFYNQVMAVGAGHPGWFSGLASKLVKKSCQVAQERCTIPSQSRMEAPRISFHRKPSKVRDSPTSCCSSTLVISNNWVSSVFSPCHTRLSHVISPPVLVLLQEQLVL